MKTQPIHRSAHATLKWLTSALSAAVILACGLGVSADAAVISQSGAKSTAKQIQKKGQTDAERFNTAVYAAQAATVGITSDQAAASAVRIVKKLSAKNQRALAGRVAIGIAMNYPQQLPSIVGALLNANTNMRKNGYTMVYQASVGGGFDQANQIAKQVSQVMAQSAYITKNARQYAEAIMAGIWNRVSSVKEITQTDRIATLGLIAGWLLKGVAGGSVGHGSGGSIKDQSIQAVVTTLAKYMNMALGSGTNRDAIYQMAAELQVVVKDLNNTAVGTLINNALNNILKPAAGVDGDAITNAINDINGGDTSKWADVGNIVHPETPYIDPDRTSTQPAF